MVWTDVVGDPVGDEGGPHEDGLPREHETGSASEPVGNPSFDTPAPAEDERVQALDGIDSTLRDIQAELAALTSKAAAFNERSAAQESIIERMQRRLEELQGDQVRALLRPVYEQLGALHADIRGVAERELRLTNDARLGKELAFLANRVETAFESLGLVSVEAEPGTPFDSRLHAAVRSKPTQDAALDKSIADVQRQGFMTPGTTKTELHARVVVYSYDPQASMGHDAGSTSPASSVAEGATSSVPEDFRVAVPAVTGRSERTPQVPLPPMPASYIEGS